MAGILANMVAGGAGGGFKAYGKNLEDKSEDKRWAEKQAALEARQKSLMSLSQKFQSGEKALDRGASSKQAIDQRAYDTKNRETLADEKRKEGILNRASKEGIAERTLASGDKGATATQLKAYNQVQEMIANGASIEEINNFGKRFDIGQWEEKSTGEKVAVEGTGIFGFFQDEEDQMEIVPSGGGGGGDVAPGSGKTKTLADYKLDFDKLSNGSTIPEKPVEPEGKTEQPNVNTPFAESPLGKAEAAVKSIPGGILQSEVANKEALASIEGKREPGGIPGVGTFKRDAGGSQEEMAISITNGIYNDNDGTILFTPATQQEANEAFSKLDNSGIKFEARQNADGSFTITINGNV